jgi:hypothetical protein
MYYLSLAAFDSLEHKAAFGVEAERARIITWVD